MSLWEAIVLGIVQGLTEFLPVSSSGHLELGKALFGLQDVDLTFSILVHGATACSTLVVFRKDIASLFFGIFTSNTSERKTAHSYIAWLALSTLPAVVVAFTMRGFLEESFLEHPHRVGWSLCATALILYASERIARTASNTLSWSRVLCIGLAQALAIVPGISRSGSTIGAADEQDGEDADACNDLLQLATQLKSNAELPGPTASAAASSSQGAAANDGSRIGNIRAPLKALQQESAAGKLNLGNKGGAAAPTVLALVQDSGAKRKTDINSVLAARAVVRHVDGGRQTL